MVVKLRIKKPLALKERDVTRQVIDFLEYNRWKCIRLNTGLFQRPGGNSRIKIGTKGQADYLCLRAPRLATPRMSPWFWGFFLEFKREGGKLSPDQVTWQNAMRTDGFDAVTVSSLNGFEQWYADKGYNMYETKPS